MSSNVTSITELRAQAKARTTRRRQAGRQAFALYAICVILLLIGLAETISAASTVEIKEGVARFSYFRRQLAGVGIGALVMMLAARVPYRVYRRHAQYIFLGVVVMLILVLVIGERVNGAKAWIDLGPVSFQPSEMAKFGVIVALAQVLERKHKLLGDWRHSVVPMGWYLGGVGLLILLQNDLGTLLVIAAAAMAVMLTSEARLRHVAFTAIFGFLAGLSVARASEERWSRLVDFRDPFADAGDTGYQAVQSLYALGNGGWFGVGLGASRARWYYLPHAHTDFIFAIIGEEAGLVGAMTVIALFVLLTVTGWAISAQAKDPFGRMLAAGLTAWLSFQAVINIGGALAALPITGVPLPLVSYGGTAVIMSMGAIGVLINIATPGSGARVRS